MAEQFRLVKYSNLPKITLRHFLEKHVAKLRWSVRESKTMWPCCGCALRPCQQEQLWAAAAGYLQHLRGTLQVDAVCCLKQQRIGWWEEVHSDASSLAIWNCFNRWVVLNTVCAWGSSMEHALDWWTYEPATSSWRWAGMTTLSRYVGSNSNIKKTWEQCAKHSLSIIEHYLS